MQLYSLIELVINNHTPYRPDWSPYGFGAPAVNFVYWDLSRAVYYNLGMSIAMCGMIGIMINRKSILLSIIAIEMMLFGVNVFLLSVASATLDNSGQVLAIFVLILAAAESAIALGLVTVYFRLYGNILIR